jgi:MFS family permease
MSSDSLSTSPAEPKTQFLEVIFLWIAGVSAAMQFAKFSVSYDAVLQYYQTSATLTGAALSVVGIAGLIFGVFGGLVASRIGYLKVLVGALLLGGMMSFIQSLLPNFTLLMLTRLIEGFSQLGVVVSAPTLIAKLSAPKHRSLSMGLWATFFGVAFAFSGWMGKSILEQYGLSQLFFSHGVFITSMSVILYVFLRNNSVLDIAPITADKGNFIRQMIGVYRNPRSLLPSVVFLFYTCTLVSLLTYIPRLVSDSKLQALLMVCLPLVSTCGTFLAGALAQYIMRPQHVALMAYSGIGISALTLSSLLDQPIVFCFAVGVLILFLGMVSGASMAMIPALARNPSEQAQSYGLIAQFGNLGGTIGPPTFALLISLYGVYGLVSLVLLICSLGVVFSYLANRIE